MPCRRGAIGRPGLGCPLDKPQVRRHRRARAVVDESARGMPRPDTCPRTCSAWITRRGGGSELACRGGLTLLDAEGREEQRLPIEADLQRNRANDAKCDPAGRSGSAPCRQTAPSRQERCTASSRAWQLEPRWRHRQQWPRLESERRRMYHIDSPTKRVDVFDYEPETGTPSHRRCLIETQQFAAVRTGWPLIPKAASGSPSGMEAPSAASHLLGTSCAITTEATRPTSCAFIGANLQTLAITTAKAPDGTGGDVYTCRPGAAGPESPTTPTRRCRSHSRRGVAPKPPWRRLDVQGVPGNA